MLSSFFFPEFTCCTMAAHSYTRLTVVPAAAPHPNPSERAARFGAALLTGAVVPTFAALKSCFNCKPQMVATREGRALQRLSDFASALAQARVDSKTALLDMWSKDGAHLINGQCMMHHA
jgi:hypothetical protein